MKTGTHLRETRHRRVVGKIKGSTLPRLVVFRSLKHIYGQLIDVAKGEVILSACDLKLGTASRPQERASEVGRALAKAALGKGIKKVVFDRGGYRYHGRVKALADGAREGGLEI